MTSSEERQPIKIAEIVPIEYSDFLTYCKISDKVFPSEITSFDYVAYRSQFGRDKSEVKKLRTIIEAGILSKKSDRQNTAVIIPHEEIDELDKINAENRLLR